MTEKKKSGRPRKYENGLHKINISVPEDLREFWMNLKQYTSENKTQWTARVLKSTPEYQQYQNNKLS